MTLADPRFRHWHPILLVRELGARPRKTTLLGVDLVVFRGSDGIGVLVDECPHRRMRLSEGAVDGCQLVCPYHGFRFDQHGHGTSPGTPEMHLDALALEVAEAWGAVWVRRRGATTAFPTLCDNGKRHFAGALSHVVEGSLEVVVDNFCEVEHTPTTHALFGYRADALAHLDVTVTSTPDSIRVVNRGPQKPIPRPISWAFGAYTDDTFIDDWTVRFSPVHILYDQSWLDPRGNPRPDSVHPVVVFVPVEPDETRLFTFVWTSRSRGPALDAVLEPILRAIVAREVRLDRAMIERLASQDPDLRGTRLGRFDAALRDHRKRIAAIYEAAETP